MKDLDQHHITHGLKEHDKLSLIDSLVIMPEKQIQTLEKLVDKLKRHSVFKYIYVFNILAKAASASTFNRFLIKTSNILF